MTLLLLFLFAIQTRADQAHREWTQIRQPDGSTMSVSLCGDEWHHYYINSDSTIVAPGDDGVFRPVVGFSHLLRSPRGAIAARRRMERRHYAVSVSTGNERRGLVLMVQFPDRSFLSDDSHSQWNAILNEEGYSQNGAPGSVHDYFMDQSNGLFNLKFDVIGPVTLSKSVYYYGQNDSNGDDLYMGELIEEAMGQVKDQLDLHTYDWDGDGKVDQLYILYAGYSENFAGNDRRLLWPHEFWLSGYPAYPDGLRIGDVVVDTYACSGELYGMQSNQSAALSGLGTFCHEFSHCLGLPDFYGSDNIGPWDIMASGNRNASGWCPAGYSAYERIFCGWMKPEQLTRPAAVRLMEPLSEGGTAYMIRNECADVSVDEYYLLENRQQRGWDRSLPGHGLLVFHVDYSQQAWDMNLVNEVYDHQRYRIISAAGADRYASVNSAYPYLGKDSLTDYSVPPAKVFNRNTDNRLLMGKPITNISESADGLLSFYFMGGIDSGIAGVSHSPSGQPPQQFDLLGRRIAPLRRIKSNHSRTFYKPTIFTNKQLNL